MSASKKQQYADGTVNIRVYRMSKAEQELHAAIASSGLDVLSQYHIQGVPYFYDIFIPHLNLLIEYQGDYWHANPRKYPSGTMLAMQNIGPVLVDNIWARDAAKKKAAEDLGYQVLYIWEMDYKKYGVQLLTKVGIVCT